MSRFHLNLCKASIFFFITFFTSSQFVAQCPDFRIILTTQAEVNDLRNVFPNCEDFQSITIEGNDITNLNRLLFIESIDFELEVKNNPVLTDISGLGRIQEVSLINIHDNPQLTTLNNLQSLNFVSGMYISGNSNLQNLNGLEGLTSATIISLRDNPSLTSLSGLDNLVEIEELEIGRNIPIVDFSGLTNLASGTGTFRVTDSETLVNFNGLQNLKELKALVVVENEVLQNFSGLDSLESISSFVVISTNPLLESLSPLNRADLSTLLDININDNPLLTDCAAQEFCDYLMVDEQANISNNGTQCSSRQEILDVCAMPCTIGDPCDDNDPCTINDQFDTDCNCVGTTQMEGDTCDDGNDNTHNDVIQPDGCTCAGDAITEPVVCDDIVVTNDANSITIAGLPTTTSQIQLFDDDFDRVYTCSNDCEEETIIRDLSPGRHLVKVKVWSAGYDELLCDMDFEFDILVVCTTDADMDGVCAEEDCDDNNADFPMVPGTACDDGDNDTEEDEIQEDGCTCAGEIAAVQPGCEEIVMQVDNDDVVVSGLDASPHSILEVFNSDWEKIFKCAGDCLSTESINDLPNGKYFVRAILFDSDWDRICEVEKYMFVQSMGSIGSSAPDIQSAEATINIENESTSIVQAAHKRSYMKIYPNPAFSNDRLYVKLYKLDDAATVVSIYDQFGRLVIQKKSEGVNEINYQFNMIAYPAGMYMISFDHDGKRLISEKLMLIRD